MKDVHVDEWLIDHVRGDLDPADRARVDVHLAACAECRASRDRFAALMTELEGVIHIAGERKSIHELARRASPKVGTTSLAGAGVHLPKDTSLDSTKWKTILRRQNPVRKS